MKTIKLLLLLAISGLTYSASGQGYPVQVNVLNANCAVTLSGMWIDSLAGMTGTVNFTLNSNTANTFTGTVGALGNPADVIYINVCATDCQGMMACGSTPIVPGTITTLNVDFGAVITVDNDGDGFPSYADCNDFNASVNPNATELCDGIDNNCEGTIDEGCQGGGCDPGMFLIPDSLINAPYYVVIFLPLNNNNGSELTGAIWDFGDGNVSTELWPSNVYLQVGTYTVCVTLSYADGCSATNCITFTVNEDGTFNPGGIQTPGFTLNVVNVMPISNGVNELENEANSAVIYPNPVTDNAVIRFNASTSGNARVECFTTQGVLVSSSNVLVGNTAFQHALVTSELANGFYVIRVVESNGTVHTGSFVK